METWIIYVVAPIAIAVVSWILGKNGRRIEETAKLVDMLQKEILRLNGQIAKLEKKTDDKDAEVERKNYVIQAAFECRTPSQKCPVLIANSKLLLIKNTNNNEQFKPRPAEQQPGKYPVEQDSIQGRGAEYGQGF